MITDGTSNWHYLAVKSISGLLRGITSNHNGDFYCLSCFHPYTTENKLRKHEMICNNHEFYHPKIPDENNKILNYIPGKKSLRVSFVIYADLECLLRKMSDVRILLKNHIQERKLHIDLQDTGKFFMIWFKEILKLIF